MNLFLYGFIFATALVAVLFFFEFWRRSKDPLFLLFAAAFALFGLERLILAFMDVQSEYKVYLIRLLGFILILAAIIQKNRRPKK